AAGNSKEALDDYADATRLAPGHLDIRRRAAAVRAQIVQKMVDEAEAAALDGHLEKATDRINDALHIDPGNAILAQRLKEMKQMRPDFLPRGDNEDYAVRGPAELKPQPGKKAINLRGDSKSVYEQAAALFGIKAAFDPELAAKDVKLRVDSVDFYTAMQLLG